MVKVKDVMSVLIGAIFLILLWLFIDEREKNKRKDEIIEILKKENQELKFAYINLLQNHFKSLEGFSPSIIAELEELKTNIDQLDSNTHLELNSVIKLVNENKGAKAVKDLAKIVEVKLKEKALQDKTFNKKPMLYNLLEHAKKCNWISSRMFENGQLLKDIRNKESHELAVEITSLQLGIAIFGGVEILYSVS